MYQICHFCGVHPQFTFQRVAGVKRLTAERQVDYDWDNLSFLTNLEELKGAPLHPSLRFLTSLKKLHIELGSGSEQADLSPLAYLTNLQDLCIPCWRGPLEPLLSLTRLKSLRYVEIGCFYDSTQLTKLATSASSVNIPRICTMTQLVSLDISNMAINPLEFRRLTNLRSLFFNAVQTKLTEEFFDVFSHLEKLSISSKYIRKFAHRLGKVKSLQGASNWTAKKTYSMSSLSQLTSLTKLHGDLFFLKSEDLIFPTTLSHLTTYVNDPQIIDKLQPLTNLQYLIFGGFYEIHKTIDVISRLTSLKEFISGRLNCGRTIHLISYTSRI